ncbi:hypothetical protein G4B88_012824 [Cannabis sativa]|uniref:Uncharacterized protein n=1 Tax=Cannabis sativa TaxID=3483 RepID=A0A7J6FUQ7_CANSA|nr:hypothetical protein G4B88_012824 [Cannabis sativa]
MPHTAIDVQICSSAGDLWKIISVASWNDSSQSGNNATALQVDFCLCSSWGLIAVKERTANANDFVNGGSHVMEYGSRSIRAEKLYLYQKVLILPLLTTHPTITNYTWLWKL